MLDNATKTQILRLIDREVVPAVGCTEPMAVALCTAKAAETLGMRPQKITALLSANILKNAMGVGSPGEKDNRETLHRNTVRSGRQYGRGNHHRRTYGLHTCGA